MLLQQTNNQQVRTAVTDAVAHSTPFIVNEILIITEVVNAYKFWLADYFCS